MKLFHTENILTLKLWVMLPKVYTEVTRPLQGPLLNETKQCPKKHCSYVYESVN